VALLDRFKRQKCVYWERLLNDVEGKPTYAAAVIIRCRWETKDQTFLDKKTGNQEVSNTQVFTDNLLVIGSAVKQVPDADVRAKKTDAELLADLDSTTVPFDNEDTWEVRQIGEQPNLRVTRYLRWALL
jgi:hypothetical protein